MTLPYTILYLLIAEGICSGTIISAYIPLGVVHLCRRRRGKCKDGTGKLAACFRIYSEYIVPALTMVCTIMMVLLLVAFERLHWVAGTVLLSVIIWIAISLRLVAKYRVRHGSAFSASYVPLKPFGEGGSDIFADETMPQFERPHAQGGGTVLSSLRSLAVDLLPALYEHKILVIITFLVSLGGSLFFSYISDALCVEVHPMGLSTRFSRSLEGTYCPEGTICHTYFIVPDDISTSLIQAMQTRHSPSSPPSSWPPSTGAYCAAGVLSRPDIGSGRVSAETLSRAYPVMIAASTVQASNMVEESRYVSWCDIIGLDSNSTYYMRSIVFDGGDDNPLVSGEYKVRTAPGSGAGQYAFVSGGDMSLDDTNERLVRIAAQKEPLFAMVGGDIAYDNGFATCYRRWDRWLSRWHDMMVTPSGYSIPMLLAIGNHEAGGFQQAQGGIAFLTTYVPHQVGLGAVPLSSRPLYHAHSIGRSSTVLSLDSWVVSPMGGEQTAFIKTQLQRAHDTGAQHTFAIYHGAIYPSVPHLYPYVVGDGQSMWEPLFSEYNLTIAFENHFHVYKRTKNIRYGKEDPDGVVYLGDGAWGVDGTLVPATMSSWWMARLEKVPFVFVCRVDERGTYVEAVGDDGNVFDTWSSWT
eukprot:TRINITY_DN12017_c0_g1_i2.p1 TRINITY_DN12017_c0_g1~~TRINITY_DN12017_c0_g1_i2.p1  ORF type:complete len:636 (-),score=118.01 TRINITY_DN12017_c0_g1_i2:31-1938(-)